MRWQNWPKSSVDSTFLTQDANPNSDQIVKGTVARASILSGEPLTNIKIVHSDATGIMAAMVSPGQMGLSSSSKAMTAPRGMRGTKFSIAALVGS